MVNKVPDSGVPRPMPLPGRGEAPAQPERPNRLMEWLAQRLGGTPQNATPARVETAAPVSEAQRQQLVSRLLDALLHWQRQPDSPEKQQQLARLAEERTLLNSPLLKLVRLVVRQEPVVTYTNRPLQPGQTVPVYQSDNRLWQLAPSPTRDSAVERLPTAAREAITDTIRRTLPLKDQPDLPPQLPGLQRLSFMQQRELLSPTVQQALRQVAQQLRHPVELSEPRALKQALSNSGLQLEQKLFKALARSGPGAPPPAAATGTETRAGASSLAATDWKGALLRLLFTTRAELARLGANPTPVRPPELNLGAFIESLAARPAPELADRSLRTQLLQRVQQLTLHSLARVQLHQSQSVAQALAPAEAGQPAQSWAFELPVRFGQEVYPLALRIDADADGETEETRGNKVRQWQVQLSFELPDAGYFHAQITVRRQQVATRLWAEEPETARAIRAQLNDLRVRLEREDIEVTQLECLIGAPPQATTDIHYALVDITT